jgi:hypothetical protein
MYLEVNSLVLNGDQDHVETCVCRVTGVCIPVHLSRLRRPFLMNWDSAGRFVVQESRFGIHLASHALLRHHLMWRSLRSAMSQANKSKLAVLKKLDSRPDLEATQAATNGCCCHMY